MRPGLMLRTAVTLVAALVAACTSGGTAIRDSDPLTLRIMSFNIEWGGTHVSFDNVAEAIRRADADIVGIQEAEGNLERLAADLGWHFDRRNYVISRFPLIDPPGADGYYVFVQVAPGRIVALGNVHLPSDPYGPYAVRDGASAEDVLEMEQETRVPAIEPYLARLPALLRQGIPVFVTGDFNAPAHTDWTAATAETRPSVRYALRWPVSAAMTAAGFSDSWRTIRPDPVSDPGFTWWAARPPLARYTLTDRDPQDRIDFVWYAGSVTARSSERVGEANAADISVMPWPSDHRAVVSEFEVKPGPVPELVSSSRRVYRQGDAVEVVYALSGKSPASLVVYSAAPDKAEIGRRRVTGEGTVSFPADRFDPGRYEVRLVMPGGTEPLAREFWVLKRDAVPSISVVGDAFGSGEPFDIRWRNAPGNRNDYVAIYAANEVASDDADPPWIYVNARPEGRVHVDAASVGRQWPLEPGRYVAWLLKDDGYESLARSEEFVVE